MTLDCIGKNSPGLDGIRGLSAVAVVTFHAGVPGCEGGFVGVEVFFVLSGFLITALLLREHDSFGRIRLRDFYMRRVLRLFPALVLLVLVVAPITLALVEPRHRLGVTFDACATLFYFQNWALALRWMEAGIFSYTWSLSVEEQFYLAWPPILVLLLALRPKPKLLLLAAGALALAAVGVGFYSAGRRPWLESYMLTHLRLGPVLIGCLLAVAIRAELFARPGPSSSLRGYAWVSLLVLGLGVVICRAEHFDYYRYGLPAIGLTTSLVILEVLGSPDGSLARFLGSAPLVWLGRRSYGIYLWHFPILAGPKLLGWDWPSRTLVTFAATFLVAGLSYRFLELPFLRLKKRFSRHAEPSPAGVAESADPSPA